MTYAMINGRAQQILTEYGQLVAPIKVEEIARAMGIKVVPYPLENGVSGVLIISPDDTTIGYNQNEQRVRRRFTVAHEIGHFVLHRDNSGDPQVFVDKNFKVMFRSSEGANEPTTMIQEREANFFAACLLMPEAMIRATLENTEMELSSEDSLRELARAFDVSMSAMNFRLINLGL